MWKGLCIVTYYIPLENLGCLLIPLPVLIEIKMHMYKWLLDSMFPRNEALAWFTKMLTINPTLDHQSDRYPTYSWIINQDVAEQAHYLAS